VGSPSIVDRITTGVDITPDNTTRRQVSPPTSSAGCVDTEKRFAAIPGAVAQHGVDDETKTQWLPIIS
jgi:hypothetical protein